ncbi:MAG: 8-oxo-dGTP diphosphatase [Massiliimalia sp.]|jgi:8-oxo-dGTP diphosphatase
MRKNERVILTNLCLIYDDQRNILLQNRNKTDWRGVAFPGGHVEPGESFVESAIREIREETGLTISNLQLCGLKQWYTDSGERYVVIFYKTNCFSGTLTSSEEGEVFWWPMDQVSKLNLAPDFEKNLNLFFSNDTSEIYYTDDQCRIL